MRERQTQFSLHPDAADPGHSDWFPALRPFPASFPPLEDSSSHSADKRGRKMSGSRGKKFHAAAHAQKKRVRKRKLASTLRRQGEAFTATHMHLCNRHGRLTKPAAPLRTRLRAGAREFAPLPCLVSRQLYNIIPFPHSHKNEMGTRKRISRGARKIICGLERNARTRKS